MANLVVILIALITLGIAACTGVIAVLEGRRWLYWRKRALAAERHAGNACAAANEHLRLSKHWMKQTYALCEATGRRAELPRPVPNHRPAPHRKERVR